MNPFASSRPLLLLSDSAVKPHFDQFFKLATFQRLILPSPAFAQGWAVSAKSVAMQQVSAEVWATLERRLDEARVPAPQRPDCRKWVRFYLDFCHKYGHRAASPTSLDPFLAKLASKNQSVAQRNQASAAVGLLLRAGPEPGAPRPALTAAPATSPRTPLNFQPPVLVGSGAPPALKPQPPTLNPRVSPAPPQTPRTAQPLPRPPPTQPGLSEPSRTHHQDRSAAPLSDTAVPDAQPARPPARGRGASWEQEYRDLEAAVLLRNYSSRTLEAYRFWIAKFQSFVRSRPPADLGAEEVRGFLSDLAVRHRVAASTQNQAFNALLFFYRHVLRREFGQFDGVVRAKRHRYVPVVLSHTETEAILGELPPPFRLVGLLLYGCGLRLMECVNPRIQCFNLDSMLLTVHDGKGQKDCTVPLPARALPEIRKQMESVRRLHAQDLAAGYAGTFLPRQLEKKYKSAPKEFIWQWFFPAPTLTFVPKLREQRRQNNALLRGSGFAAVGHHRLGGCAPGGSRPGMKYRC